MTFYVIAEIIAVSVVIVYGYVWKGPRGKTMSTAKLARYRWATLFALGWAVIILVRLMTHTYK